MIKISQSFLKEYFKWASTENRRKQGEKNIADAVCGKRFKAMYIDKTIQSVPSDAMKEGIYFEYLATGSLPKSGEVPIAEKTKSGGLTVSYQRITEAVDLFKKVIAHYKIKIIKVGYTLADDEKSGVIDIYAEWNGEKVFIDTKYSGLIDDKWSEMGWETESLPMKDNLMIQGVHYKILAQDILQIEDIPFYYFIFNSKNSSDMKIIKQNVDTEKIHQHRETITSVRNQVEKLLHTPNAFRAYPDFRKCKDCPLFDSCEERAVVPEVIDVNY